MRKQKNVSAAKAAPEWGGDTWTWIALDADSKLIVSAVVGGRDSEYAMAFALEAVEGSFGADVDMRNS